MKLSMFFVFAAAFLYECPLRSKALSMANPEKLDLDQETLQEGLIENTAGSSPSKILVVADFNLLKTLKALDRNVLQQILPERILSTERRDVNPDLGSSIAIIKRDSMRCMVGRVYRPCWEV
ncbi:pro-melanin-concentrating hormone, like [Trichomycterus rosablanca]|uniref:pro-melanin-concentrating hormone, like n=1 Tax=Trichomycterus rosablanca TaxID=2290929 RepID=UPI002F35A4A2